MKFMLVIFVIALPILSLIERPAIAVLFCCEQGDPGTCAIGIGPTRYYCYDTMAKCMAGTCDASF